MPGRCSGTLDGTVVSGTDQVGIHQAPMAVRAGEIRVGPGRILRRFGDTTVMFIQITRPGHVLVVFDEGSSGKLRADGGTFLRWAECGAVGQPVSFGEGAKAVAGAKGSKHAVS